MKFNSSRLKEYNYKINNLDYIKAKKLGEVIGLADNQMLRSIRKIQGRYVDLDEIDQLYIERDKLLNRARSKENKEQINIIQTKINSLTFIPEYITIVMNHNSHYEYLFNNGLELNGKKYVRLSCSAGQARVSTVVFCEEEVDKQLNVILNNGRNPNIPLTPSKFNAYFGLSGSATKIVSTPTFCVVPDYERPMSMTVNYVTETDYELDDIIDIRTVESMFNRFDGQGLISVKQSKKWADELGLDYIPAQWCVRQNFIKGMLCTFDIHEFAKEINNGNYLIRTSYKDEYGNYKIVDLRDIDVILSESQFKLWDSFESAEVYQENCKKNNLYWGVSLFTPKQDKNILKLNYQFLQTLNWNKKDIEQACEMFVDWIEGVNSENIYYTLLFLLGENIDENKLENYFSSSSNHWIKALMLNHDLLKDKYIRTKIYDLIKTRIQRACLGEILVEGNFQVIVSDPYAQMQHVCGIEVTGLLKADEYYSAYWNKKSVTLVDSMRAPLTFRSEHLKLNLVKRDLTEKWYKYCYTGILVNVFGKETVHWSGSDFDYDILATTSNETIIKGVYDSELPVVYEAPKSVKIIPERKDLYQADLFAFGSQIGAITNKSTSGYALLPLHKENSKEYQVIMNRLKMCTKLQSAQIDKAKIGRDVKGIPSAWVKYNKVLDTDSDEDKATKELLNNTLLDKHPYFFIYLYKDTKRRYKKHYDEHNFTCLQRFKMNIEDLERKKRKTVPELDFLHTYFEYLPVIDSDSLMNNLCKYIESIDFNIKDKIKSDYDPEIYKTYMNHEISWNESNYNHVREVYDFIIKNLRSALENNIKDAPFDLSTEGYGSVLNGKYQFVEESLIGCGLPIEETVNCLIEYLYRESPSKDKNFLWNIFGEFIVGNITKNINNIVKIPISDPNGNFEYLGNCYTITEVKN